MKKMLWAVAAASLSASATAAPLSFDISKAYVGGLGSYLLTDSARPNDYGAGIEIIGGVPLNEYLNAEANLFAHYLPRESDSKADLSHGLGVDLLLIQHAETISSFLLLGGGVVREDVSRVENVAGFANAGFGFMGKLPVENLSWRAEARGVMNFNDDATGTSGDSVTDVRLGLGVVYGIGYKAKEVPPADTDGDGVNDPTDQCPATPPGTAVDAVGCPLAPADTDADGVVDTLDQCPATPAGDKVDERGCTVVVPAGNPDLDADGVLNGADQCPDTPTGFKVDGIGCMVEQTVALQSVNFEFGSDALTAEAKAILDGIAKSLAAQTAVKIQVSGHTDSLGPQSYNLTLSQKRAKSVVSYLGSVGVDAARLSSEGEGEFAPIASNDTEEGRAKNRRVEFKILTQ